ncbi:MAG: N-acetylgalactosamine-6-sulfatase [Verrucomicrobiota bacterium]|nr:sulfatase [Oleiharenicola lentus]MDQ5981174.1 N-acetylgalactosamine-6-sulfatase [Verrucomicrobiota bacterium]
MKLTALLSSLLLTCTGLLHAGAPDSAERPNVVIILADDLGYGDLGCYGHPTVKTPNLDRLAATGARFTQFNCPAPYCAPTRASLLTGRYPFRHGLTGNPAPDGQRAEEDSLHLPTGEITLAQLFQQAGYATGMVGKWHLGHARPEWLPTRRGFDEYLGILYSNDMRPVQLVESEQPIEYPLVQANLTQRYTARAINFIKRNQSRGFFLYLAHAMPHKPLAASEAFYRKSGTGLYGDVMTELDWSVGEVMKTLRELGLEEKTLVIFAGDNGPFYGGSTGGLRGMKASSYEGGYRTPCLARWPGKIPAGHTNRSPAVMMDLFTTTLNAAGIAPPADRVIDGRDLMPQLTSDAASPHKVILGQLGPRVATIRDARWKLHVLPASDQRSRRAPPGERWLDPRGPDGVTILAPAEQYSPDHYPGLTNGDAPAPMQLFDLESDPGEQHDVAAAHPEIVVRLRQHYENLMQAAAESPAPPPS